LPESGSNLLLSINTTKETYTIQTSIYFSPVAGTTESESSKGGKTTWEAESWNVNASFKVDGKMDGDLIDDSWSEPAEDKMAVTSQTGLLPGCTWNWSLRRTERVR